MTPKAVVFIVDASDPDRFDEAAAELKALLREPDAAHLPVLCFGNKIDRLTAVPRSELVAALGLNFEVGASQHSRTQGSGWFWSATPPLQFHVDDSLVTIQRTPLLNALYTIPPILETHLTTAAGLGALAQVCHAAHAMVQPLVDRLKEEAMQSLGVNPHRPIALCMCSTVRKFGLMDGFNWLSRQILGT